MSVVVDEKEQVGEEFSELDAFDEESEQETPEEAAQAEEVAEYEVPEKFKDKPLEDIVRSYQELEKEYGRRNNEIGELRKLVDQALDLQLSDKTKEETPNKEIDIDSLLENPSEALSSLLENHPKLREFEEALVESKREKQAAQFEQKHPDWKDIVGSQQFQQWVMESPVRQDMFKKADNYDYNVGDELLTVYKQIQGVNSQSEEEGKKKRDKAFKDAGVEKGSTAAKSKKIFRRSDLLKLRMNDPEKYASMEPEIIKAYQEGRVR